MAALTAASSLAATTAAFVAPVRATALRVPRTPQATGAVGRHMPRTRRLVVAAAGDRAAVDWAAVRTTDHLTVGDCMSAGRLVCAQPSTTVDQALELLVEHRITGMPVVDEGGRLVGVVSDYDLLALDSISGVGSSGPSSSLFPEAGSTWKAFKEIQKLLIKTRGRVVADVMTPHPHTVLASTNLDHAARMLLENQHRRLPVVDDTGKLVGLLTRGNVVKAALALKRAAERDQAKADAS
ncbi:hypothetical protein CLOM_g17298 [Closterium sp. NIES-68]|nr:hypothetical protein CLOM_g17298 [Closterium sp. NIES-68]GJP79096.1 hypothetical protein CLOP_g9339 [Closterium sp. NIES-67]